MDIVEHKRAEEALRESEERFRAVFESAPIGMAIGDAEGRPVQVNRALREMLGYTEREMESMVYTDFTHPDDVEESVRLVEELLAGKRDSFRIEKRYCRKDGRIVWASMVVSAFRDAEGQRCYVAMIEDVTERKRAEEALRESEESYRDLHENAPAAYFVVGFDGRISRANRGAADLLGYDIDALVGRPVFDVYADTPAGKETAERTFERFRAGEDTRDEEVEFRRADGTSVWVSRTVRVIRDEAGEIVESRSWAVDISERKRMEEALQDAREQLEGKVERQMLRRNPYGLTFREFTVLHLVSAGRSDKEIGLDLGISPLTAHKHLSNILAKMGVASRTEAVARALREGLID